MDISNLEYKSKTATEAEIYTHLKECDDNFIPPLSEKVDVQEYSKKLYGKSVTFEAWSKNILAGLVAAYFNDPKNQTGYITNVSLIKDYSGRGIASRLIEDCIQYAKQNKFREIRLEVNKDNGPAIHLYKKYGFIEYEKNDNSLFMMFKVS
ncbi:MAG: GNAT family N-acetyltransferase [Candidatus Kerfeldbacteria bacterium CG_4_10_14_0_8_um_filter_42_10]|uniref:GNAT family N-acetyltransferase n=1 Tax=Candidatus Kerfeldbacteria bacterium CG_4_10_14_0_8_um_filter_42_10 TaxID=2014248 RepID=A0A2M7RL60_9BACT|nr:MAG: GNAT family N-acetyltransferase [Candidatus Kerfeldbacteria bacterium CG_4_10_14_0_8_um_filter_42_10]